MGVKHAALKSNSWQHYAALCAGLIGGLLLSTLFFHAYGLLSVVPTRPAFQTVRSLTAQAAALRSQRDSAFEQLTVLNTEITALRSAHAAAAPPQAAAPDAATAAQDGGTNPAGSPLLATARTGPGGSARHTPWTPSAERDAASLNPDLARVLREVAIYNEVVVAVSNRNLAKENGMLQHWCTAMDLAGVKNKVIVALDPYTKRQAETWGTAAVYVNIGTASETAALYTGATDNHSVSGKKFLILQQFLALGYAVLLSDVDIVTLSNPFDALVRDSDVEGMSDGWNRDTAYGYNDVFDDPHMGWSRWSHSIRISSMNSGLFYIRPTPASMDLLDTVRARLAAEKDSWDQALFNEVIFLPSRPGYTSPFVTRRIMDSLAFMNSKVFFRFFRKDARLFSTVVPVMVHVNYHSDKLQRMLAIEQYYMHGSSVPVMAFPDASL